MPAERRRALGNPGHQKQSPVARVVEPLPTELLSAPLHLGRAGASTYEFVLQSCNWIAKSDFLLLVAMCEQVDEIVKWSAKVVEDGEVLISPNGAAQAHPLLAHIRDARKQVYLLAASMGLSPSDRGRIGLGEVQAMSKLASLRAAEKRQ